MSPFTNTTLRLCGRPPGSTSVPRRVSMVPNTLSDLNRANPKKDTTETRRGTEVGRSLTSSDGIQRHPPERGTQSGNRVVLLSGCSCCCCCLHSLGGLIGVAVVGNYRAENAEAHLSPLRSEPLPSGQRMFWSSFLWVTLTTMVLGALITAEQYNDPFAVFILFAIFAPAWLLGACLISALQISIRIPVPLQRGYWLHLGRLLLGIVIGTGIGGVLVFGMMNL